MIQKLYTIALCLVLSSTLATAQVLSSVYKREPEMSIYPQPANSQITVSFENVQLQSAKVNMYDMLGNLVAEINAERFDQGAFTIYVGDKKPGYYFLKIYTDFGTYNRRITIKP